MRIQEEPGRNQEEPCGARRNREEPGDKGGTKPLEAQRIESIRRISCCLAWPPGRLRSGVSTKFGLYAGSFAAWPGLLAALGQAY